MACADRSDPAHLACTAARDATLEAGRILITTDFVVDETLTLIRFRLGLAAATAWWQQIDGSARLRWERVESDRFERARNLFFQYRDKDLSFTPVRCELVAEVSYENLLNGRLRHGARFQRWRPDREPTSCTYAQLEQAAPYELHQIFGV